MIDQTLTSQSLLARQAIRHLLDGHEPNGTQPEDCGDWGPTLELLLDAHAEAGTAGVKRSFNAQAKANPGLGRLVAGDRDAVLLAEGADDEGNAQCLKAMHGEQFRYSAALEWLYYTGGCWEREGARERLDRAATGVLKERRRAAVDAERDKLITAAKPSARNRRNCLDQFRSLVDVSVNDFDKSPDLLNCGNGVLDLRTGELTPHDATQLFTYCIRADYDADADVTEWLDFLHGVIGDAPEVIEYLQATIGYSLTGRTREEVMFYLHGPTRSGKGTFIETLLALLGRPLATEADFGIFTRKRDSDAQNFDLAPLKPCRFVAASESNKYERLNGAKVKSITGGNYIYCAHKHKPHFSYRPQFKVWLSSNHNVNGDPDDDALWARLRVIEFPHSFLGQEDKRLKERLLQPSALAGLLAWAVEGAKLWYKADRYGLKAPERVARLTEKARRDVDYVAQWLEECISHTGSADNFIPNAALHASYKSWCDDNGVTPKKLGGLTGALKAKGYRAGVQKWHRDKKMRGCVGVCFQSDPQMEPLNL